LCRLNGETTAQRKPLKLDSGQSDVIEFRRKNLKPGQYQAEVTLVTADALPVNNVRFVTFEVRGARKILTITDDPAYARLWQAAFELQGDFQCDVKTPVDITSIDDLKPYLAVCLFSVRQPARPEGDSLWSKVDRYVQGGGHLVVVPGRNDVATGDYNSDAAQKLLPGRFEKTISLDPSQAAPWQFNFKHLFMAKFKEWAELGTIGFMKRPRTVTKYWQIKAPPENVVVWYLGAEANQGDPALLERVAGRPKGSGRVLLFTTALDEREDEKEWHDYLGTEDRSVFYVVIANEAISYMVGDKEELTLNFPCGQTVVLPVPPSARVPEYQLDGPGISGAETRVSRAEAESELRLRQTQTPGNFTVGSETPPWKSRFSLNPPGSEFQLERVPVEEIEKLLGKDAVVAVGRNKPLRELMTTKMRQPIELLPWLMGLLVFGLAVEALLANRFYKDETPATGTKAPS
jgi:hypothetical protein